MTFEPESGSKHVTTGANKINWVFILRLRRQESCVGWLWYHKSVLRERRCSQGRKRGGMSHGYAFFYEKLRISQVFVYRFKCDLIVVSAFRKIRKVT